MTFNIRTFMASLDEVRRIPAWAEQLATVIETLDERIAAYKASSTTATTSSPTSAGTDRPITLHIPLYQGLSWK